MEITRFSSRWFAAGIAVTLAVGISTSTWRASASPGSDESTFVPVNPTRILDTRNPINVGLDGPFVSATSQKLRVTGAVPTTEGIQTVVPEGANGVVLNVTVAQPTASGFVSVRPGNATGAPATSSLNFDAGVVQPNAVTVELPTSGSNAGMIDITYDAYGTVGPTTELLIDVVGYTTNAGLQSIVADLAAKANANDVYTKNQTDNALASKANADDIYTKNQTDAALASKADANDVYSKSAADATFLSHGTVVVEHGHFMNVNAGITPTTVSLFSDVTRFTGDGIVNIAITRPETRADNAYGLVSVEYCLGSFTAPAFVTQVSLVRSGGNLIAFDATDRTTPGCYDLPVGDTTSGTYGFAIIGAGGGEVRVSGVRSTWAPAELITTNLGTMTLPETSGAEIPD